jgi:hypothetical protein
MAPRCRGLGPRRDFRAQPSDQRVEIRYGGVDKAISRVRAAALPPQDDWESVRALSGDGTDGARTARGNELGQAIGLQAKDMHFSAAKHGKPTGTGNLGV